MNPTAKNVVKGKAKRLRARSRVLANGGGFGYDSDMIDTESESQMGRPCGRWRKTKWFYGIMLTYCGVTIAAMIWWSAYSHAKFEEAVAPIITRGEPLAWSDFATDPIPDDRNAAVLYKQAVNASVMPGWRELRREFKGVVESMEDVDFDLVEDLAARRGLRRKYPEEVRKLLGMLKDVFRLCRDARRRDKVDWGIDFSGNVFEATCDIPLQLYVRAARMLKLAAVEAHDAGRDDEAIEYLRDIIALGDSLAINPVLVNYLVAMTVNGNMHEALEEVLPDIKIGQAPGCARPENLRGLMAELLDDSRLAQGLELAMMGERSTAHDICQRVMNMDLSLAMADSSYVGSSSERSSPPNIFVRTAFDYSLAPMFRIDAAWLLEHGDAHVKAAGVGTLPESRRILRPAIQDLDQRRMNLSHARILSALLAPSLRRTFVLHYFGLTHRRLSAAAIAVRMYQQDNGRRPEKLEDLIPKYLSEIPQDPMNEPGEPIRYIADSDMPRLYSVGKNARDERGVYDDQAKEGDDAKEMLFFLNGRPNKCKREWEQDSSGQSGGDD